MCLHSILSFPFTLLLYYLGNLINITMRHESSKADIGGDSLPTRVCTQQAQPTSALLDGQWIDKCHRIASNSDPFQPRTQYTVRSKHSVRSAIIHCSQMHFLKLVHEGIKKGELKFSSPFQYYRINYWMINRIDSTEPAMFTFMI